MTARRWAPVGLALSIVGGLVGSTAQPADALVGPLIAPVVIPVAAGAAEVVIGGTAGLLLNGLELDFAGAASDIAGFAWNAGVVGLAAWQWAFGADAEEATIVEPDSSSAFNGGCWAKTWGTTRTCNETATPVTGTYLLDEIAASGTDGITYHVTLIDAPARLSTTEGLQVAVAWEGGTPAVVSTASQMYPRCSVATLGADFNTAVQWAWRSAMIAAGGSSGEVTHTFPSTSCTGTLNGHAALGWLGLEADSMNGCCGLAASQWLAGGTGTPESSAAPEHRIRTTKICAVPGGGTPTTVDELSAAYRQADEDQPEWPNPTCAPGVATEMYIDETDLAGDFERRLLTWTAPDLEDLVVTHPEYSDCLPGGSAFPCDVRLLKTSPLGLLECTRTDVDCLSFDPETSTQLQYQCRWGSHVVALAQCAPTMARELASQIDEGTDSNTGTDTDVVTDDLTEPSPQTNKGCMGGGWGWNPVDWIMKPVQCALKWAFVPPTGTFNGVVTGVGDSFPINVAIEATDAVQLWSDAATDEGSFGTACGPLIAPGAAAQEFMPDGVDGLGDIKARLPTPSTSGCDGMSATGSRSDIDDQVGDLFGFREFVRALAMLGLWVGVFFKVVSSFGGGADDLEVNPFDGAVG